MTENYCTCGLKLNPLKHLAPAAPRRDGFPRQDDGLMLNSRWYSLLPGFFGVNTPFSAPAFHAGGGWPIQSCRDSSPLVSPHLRCGGCARRRVLDVGLPSFGTFDACLPRLASFPQTVYSRGYFRLVGNAVVFDACFLSGASRLQETRVTIDPEKEEQSD